MCHSDWPGIIEEFTIYVIEVRCFVCFPNPLRNFEILHCARCNFLHFEDIFLPPKGIRTVANLGTICPRHKGFGLANTSVANGQHGPSLHNVRLGL